MALDPNKKFLYFNKDATVGEMDLALCFPVSSFIGLETQTSSIIHFYFEGSKGADANIVEVVHSQFAYMKNFVTSLVDEINFGDNAFIKVYDHAERTTHPSDVSINMTDGIPPTFTLEDDEFIVAGDLRVNGKLSFDGIAGIYAIDYNTAFIDSDIRLMTSKAINNRFAQINADTTGNAATATLAADATKLATPRAIGGVNFDGSSAINLPGVNTSGNQATSGLAATATLAADATTLATPRAINGVDFDGSAAITVTSATLTTPRAINGVDFDGSAAITVTAAGSTLSDTVTVAKGGTGLQTVATNTMLTGNGTSALTAEANLTYDGTNLQLASDATAAPDLILLSTSNHLTGSNLIFNKLRADDTPADNDFIGTIVFQGEDDGGSTQVYGTMTVQSNETEAGEEDGKLSINVAAHDGGLASGLILEGGNVDDEVDVTIAKGAASVTTVAGTLTMGSTAFVNNSGVVQVATQGTIDHDSLANFASNEHYTQANIVATGTIASGTWEGTDVGVAHGGTGASNLDAFGLLGGTQTFTGKKVINTRRFPISSGTDGNAIGDVVYFGGTTSMTIGTIYHYKSDGTWEQADADAVATSDGLLGVALGSASDTSGMLLRGMVTLDHDPGAVGDVLFLSTTAGDATATAPSGNNDIVRVIGYCLHASAGNIWFNPDNTFVEVTA